MNPFVSIQISELKKNLKRNTKIQEAIKEEVITVLVTQLIIFCILKNSLIEWEMFLRIETESPVNLSHALLIGMSHFRQLFTIFSYSTILFRGF